MEANDALLLVGHGSARYPGAASAMHRHADTLRAEPRFARVEVALLNGEPSIADALRRIAPATIRVVPFFMEDGYFSRVAVPEAIQARLSANGGSTKLVMCPPIGIHDGMAGLVERAALSLCASSSIPSATAAVLVVGHGSAKSPGRALALHRHASRVAATELFARVEFACLEEPPFVAAALHSLRAHPVLVIGFFANHGGHVRDDLPALIATERAARGDAGQAVILHDCIADDPAVSTIILDQAGEQQ